MSKEIERLFGLWPDNMPSWHDADLTQYEKALDNFRAYHGAEPHPAMNMFAIIRDYSVPWRKTTIPRVPALHRRRMQSNVQKMHSPHARVVCGLYKE